MRHQQPNPRHNPHPKLRHPLLANLRENLRVSLAILLLLGGAGVFTYFLGGAR